MSDFLYFWKTGRSSVTRDHLEQLGLGYVHDGKPISSKQTQINKVGPGGSRGLVFGVRDAFGLKVDEDSQIWTKHPLIEDIWVGYDIDSPPTPEGLARQEQVSGHMIARGGHVWMIPRARLYDMDGYENTLPKSVELRSDGFAPGEVIAKYKHLEDLATEVFDNSYGQFVDADEKQNKEVRFTLPDKPLEKAAELFKVNYRIGQAEFAILNLATWDFNSIFDILKLVIDEPGMREIAQKKTPSGD